MDAEPDYDGQAHALELVLLHAAGKPWRVYWDDKAREFVALRNRWMLTRQPTAEAARSQWPDEVRMMV